jgi:hypothetical protein
MYPTALATEPSPPPNVSVNFPDFYKHQIEVVPIGWRWGDASVSTLDVFGFAREASSAMEAAATRHGPRSISGDR